MSYNDLYVNIIFKNNIPICPFDDEILEPCTNRVNFTTMNKDYNCINCSHKFLLNINNKCDYAYFILNFDNIIYNIHCNKNKIDIFKEYYNYIGKFDLKFENLSFHSKETLLHQIKSLILFR